MSKVMMIGLGRVGQQVLEYLVEDPKCPELVFCNVDEAAYKPLVDNALIGASMHGLYPSVKFRELDLTDDIDHIADVIKEEKPDIIVDMTVLMPMHGFYKLPKEQFDYLYSANFGVWLPCQVALVYRLQLAVQKSGLHPFVMTTGIPDNVNPALGTVGLAPVCGCGNININVLAVRYVVAQQMKVPMELVKVWMVSSHALVVWPRDPGCYKKTPYFIKIQVNGKDVTDQFDTDKLIWDSMRLYPAAPSTAFYSITSKSIITNMYALLSDEGVFTHVPGPNGLPGGYPVIISKRGVELALPEEITEEEAIAINMKAINTSDSIERFEEGGECYWADYAFKVLNDLLGIEENHFNVKDSMELAEDIMARYKKFAAKYGVE